MVDFVYTTMVDNRLVKLTPVRTSILELTQSAGAVSASDVAREVIRGQNKRSANAQLSALHRLGLLMRIRVCEYRLSDAGQAWLDLRADAINARAKAGAR